MALDMAQFEKAAALPAAVVAEKYLEHIKACANWCIRVAEASASDNEEGAKILQTRAEWHEQVACEYGGLLGFACDETDDFINDVIKRKAPQGCQVEYW